jgi:hypothetical protein
LVLPLKLDREDASRIDTSLLPHPLTFPKVVDRTRKMGGLITDHPPEWSQATVRCDNGGVVGTASIGMTKAKYDGDD